MRPPFVDDLLASLLARLGDAGLTVPLATHLAQAARAAFEGRMDDAAASWSAAMQAVEAIDVDALERLARVWSDRMADAVLNGRDDALDPALAFIGERLAPILEGVWAADVQVEDLVAPALQWISDACVEVALGAFGRSGG